MRPERPTDLETEHFEAVLRQAVRVLPTDPEDALEALEREADRRPPCKANGEGGRDTAIYLTALRAARGGDGLASAKANAADQPTSNGRPLPVIFVTEDKGFSDPQDRTAFAPVLREEIADAPLSLCLDIVSALSGIGYPSSWVDAKSITEREDFLALLREAVTRETLDMLSPAPLEAFPEWVRVRTLGVHGPGGHLRHLPAGPGVGEVRGCRAERAGHRCRPLGRGGRAAGREAAGGRGRCRAGRAGGRP